MKRVGIYEASPSRLRKSSKDDYDGVVSSRIEFHQQVNSLFRSTTIRAISRDLKAISRVAYVTNDTRQIKMNAEIGEKIKIFGHTASLGPERIRGRNRFSLETRRRQYFTRAPIEKCACWLKTKAFVYKDALLLLYTPTRSFGSQFHALVSNCSIAWLSAVDLTLITRAPGH